MANNEMRKNNNNCLNFKLFSNIGQMLHEYLINSLQVFIFSTVFFFSSHFFAVKNRTLKTRYHYGVHAVFATCSGDFSINFKFNFVERGKIQRQINQNQRQRCDQKVNCVRQEDARCILLYSTQANWLGRDHRQVSFKDFEKATNLSSLQIFIFLVKTEPNHFINFANTKEIQFQKIQNKIATITLMNRHTHAKRNTELW